ncbi:MAG: protein kinase [Verrucomicrobia subdivision 3 bacterium]|nr:protein kinase [Limisphaerales bacterium]
MTRQLAAIVFTDIAGFTALSSRDESAAFAALEKQRALLKPLVAEYGGEWLKEMGDGLLLSFPSSLKAVHCAVVIQQTTAAEEHLNLRVGIHQGDIIAKDGDVFGDGVNIASRVEPHAPVGGVAMTHRVQEDIASHPDFTTESIGFPPLKGVGQQMELHCVVSHGLPRPEKKWNAAGAGETPDEIGGYKLVRAIGRGAFGEIWLAQSVTGKFFALKIVRRSNFDDDGPYQREFHGIQQYENISRGHPGLVDLLHVGGSEKEGYFYYVMELADDQTGQPLSDPDTYEPRTLLSDRRLHTRLSTDDTLRVGITLARGLAHLHGCGFLHRDVKPANVIYVNGQARLADIGLLTAMDNAATLVGTPAYMPPEGPGRAEADIYSLGIVLYEMATAQEPTQFPAFPEVSADSPSAAKFHQLQATILKAAAQHPDHRYAEAGQLATELEQILQDTLTTEPQYRVQKDNQQWGPFTQAELSSHVASGTFTVDDLCWTEAHGDWQPVGTVLGVEPQAAPVAAKETKAAPVKLIAATGIVVAVLALLAIVFMGDDEAPPDPDGPNGPGAQSPTQDWGEVYSGEAHEGMIRAVAFDPNDSTILATISDVDGDPPKVWSYTSGKLLATLSGHTHEVMCLAFHPANPWLASGSGDDKVLIHELSGGKRLHELAHEPVDGRDGSVACVAWSARGDRLVTGLKDHTLHLWNPENGSHLAQLGEHPIEVNAVAFSPVDNKTGASICEAGEIKTWNNNEGQAKHLATHRDGGADIAFSSDGSILATAGNNGNVILWSAHDGETLATLEGHEEGVMCVAFHPNGKWLASGSDDDTVILWDLASCQVFKKLQTTEDVNALAFSADGSRLAAGSADGTVKVWAIPTR